MMLRLVEKAAQTGQHRIILLMQDIGWSDFDEKGEERRTPLAWAALGRHTETVQALLNVSPDVETMDIIGRTPLSLSIGLTTLYSHKYIRYKGTKIRIRETDTIEAGEGLKVEMRKTPKAWELDQLKPGDPNSTSGPQLQPQPTPKGLKDVVDLLLAAQADKNSPDNRGHTPITLADSAGYNEVVKQLERGSRA